MEVLITLSISQGLAFLSGINAYLPLLIIGIIERFHLVPGFHLNHDYGFLTSYVTLTILALLTIADFVLDKIPGASGVWNTVHTLLRPIAGALIAGAVGMNGQGLPLILMGAVTATLSHVTKMGIRTSASAVTGGAATPLLSIIEDIGVVVGTILVFVAPLLILALLIIFLALFILFAPSILGTIRYQLRVMAAFLSSRKAPPGQMDFLTRLRPGEQALLSQTFPQAQFQAGTMLLWHKQLNGRGPWGRRRVALPACFIATNSALLLFPASRSHLSLVIPFASVNTLALKKGIFKGTLTVHEHNGPRHQFTILRTEQKVAEQVVSMLHTHYRLPSPARGFAGMRPSWLGR